MNITLKLNGELIKYGLCHIYSNSALSTPVILSNGNGAGTNTITANLNGVVQLTASNCPAYIYCRIESSPSYVNSANFRLKTGAISGYSASAAAKTIDMGFNSSNIFVATNAKCAIGFDLLTLGYRYSLKKISPSSFPTSTATANMFLYNKAFTYKAINSLDKTSYGSTTTQSTFGTYSSMNVTNMLNTTRGVNLSTPSLTLYGLTKSGDPLYDTSVLNDYSICYDYLPVYIGGYSITTSKVIANFTITPSVNASGAYILASDSTILTGNTQLRHKGTIMQSAYDSGWIPLACFTISDTSQLAGITIDSNTNAYIASPDNLILSYNYMSQVHYSELAVSLCLCEIDENAESLENYYKVLSFYNRYHTINPQPSEYENDIYIPVSFPIGGTGLDDGVESYHTPNNFCFKQNTTYALFVRVIYDTQSAYKYVKLVSNLNVSDIILHVKIPEKVVTFTNVNKNPLVPMYLTLVSGVNSCKLSYLKISYSNYSYTTGNSSGTLDSGKATSALHWLNANPARIGVSGSVSYTNLYKNINISGGNDTTGARTKKTTTYIAKATPAVSYNGFTTTQWYTTQSSTKTYATNAVFNISAITSTNIKYSINEVLSGKHKLTQICVDVS